MGVGQASAPTRLVPTGEHHARVYRTGAEQILTLDDEQTWDAVGIEQWLIVLHPE